MQRIGILQAMELRSSIRNTKLKISFQVSYSGNPCRFIFAFGGFNW